MICQNCGSDIPENSLFCCECGAKITVPQVEADVELNKTTQSVHDSTDFSVQTVVDPQILDSGKKPRKKVRVGKIIAIFLFGLLFAASIGLNAYQYIQNEATVEDLSGQLAEAAAESERLSAEGEQLKFEIDQRKSEIEEHLQTIEDLHATVSEKESTIRLQESTISTLESEKQSLKQRADAFDKICSELRYSNVGYAASNYFATTGVVILDTWSSDQFTVTADWSSAVTVTLKEGTGIVDAKWAEKWNGDTIDVTVTSSGSTGVDIITFTNNKDSKTFKVLVIVTD